MTVPTAETIVIVLLAAAAYPYLGYPVILDLLTRRRQDPPPPPPAPLPSVTLVISAYDEEEVIVAKIENLKALLYPRERLRVLIGSDGSGDATVRLARAAIGSAGHIEVVDFEHRRGKPAVLHDLITRARSDVIALSDANTLFAPDAIEQMARWFADPGVGCVCGRLQLVPTNGTGRSELAYWTFETWLKRRENRLGAVLGANGGIYAFRRAAYVPIPRDTITDDFVLPMLIRGEGYRIVFDPSARGTEETAPTIANEFTRRVRIGAGNLQALWQTRRLLSLRFGWTALAYWSHKVLRWTAPALLLSAVLLALARADGWMLAAIGIGGVMLVALASAGWALERSKRRLPPIVAAPYAFVAMNAALVIGAVRLLRGTQSTRWSRTPRASTSSSRD